MTLTAPMLLIGLTVGLMISLFQALTQIQEQTLVFVPKIASMMTVAVLLMPWIFERILEYASAMFSNAPLP
jgi:flagellar biosynthesis protein FliQ